MLLVVHFHVNVSYSDSGAIRTVESTAPNARKGAASVEPIHDSTRDIDGMKRRP